ncbi:MAG: DUF5685 family protein, partial [Clostridia bacterium]|nr:DUF5685 family protein [Clostridia bacterium]
MFGYVKPDSPYMYMKDLTLYKAMYCGLCKSIGKYCGEKARLVLNYDLTFLSVFLHNVMNVDVEIKEETCVIHHIKKRPVAKPDFLSEKIGALNVILAGKKLQDDVDDENKGKIKNAFFSSSVAIAKKKEGLLSDTVDVCYKRITDYEKTNGKDAVVVSEFFGELLVEIVKVISENYFTEDIRTVVFNLGKWIYLIDALDDYDKDIKKKSFNPFVNGYGEPTKKEFLEKHGDEINFIFGDILYEIEDLIASSKHVM